jgi:hypothetical protein
MLITNYATFWRFELHTVLDARWISSLSAHEAIVRCIQTQFWFESKLVVCLGLVPQLRNLGDA